MPSFKDRMLKYKEKDSVVVEPVREKEAVIIAEPIKEEKFYNTNNREMYAKVNRTNNSMSVYRSTDLLYVDPSDFGKRLLAPFNGNAVVIKDAQSDIEPLDLQAISDRDGSIGERLLSVAQSTGTYVLPLKELGIPEFIDKIQDFEIINLNGKKFASYRGVNVDTSFVDKLIEKVSRVVATGRIYGAIVDTTRNGYVNIELDDEESRINRTVILNGEEIEVNALCNYESNYFNARLRNYYPNVIMGNTGNDDCMRVVVGISL